MNYRMVPSRKAYITRVDAAILSQLWVKDIAVNDVMACKPETGAHCVVHDLGPQHECSITFRCKPGNLSRLKSFLDIQKCKYTVK